MLNTTHTVVVAEAGPSGDDKFEEDELPPEAMALVSELTELGFERAKARKAVCSLGGQCDLEVRAVM